MSTESPEQTIARLSAENAELRKERSEIYGRIGCTIPVPKYARGPDNHKKAIAVIEELSTQNDSLRARLEAAEKARDEWRDYAKGGLVRPDELVEQCEKIRSQFLAMEERDVEQQERISKWRALASSVVIAEGFGPAHLRKAINAIEAALTQPSQ